MIDSHCHIAGEEFSADLDAVVDRARGAGVTSAACILAAGDAAEAEAAVRVRALWPGVRLFLGVHPHGAGAFTAWAAADLVRAEVRARGASAIGEIGLDYHYDLSPRDVQQEVFAAQVALAGELRLPVVIHTREATDDTFHILREAGGGRARGIFHCFTGDLAMARRALDIGFHLSFAGIVTFPRATLLREVAAFVPPDRILAETDSPYLSPVPHRGSRNEPARVVHVYDTLAGVRRVPHEELAAEISRNFDALVGPVSPPVGGSDGQPKI